MLYSAQKYSILRFTLFLLGCILLVGTVVTPAGASGTGWYCTRAKNHAQPVADPSLREVEEWGGYYIDHCHTSQDDSDKVVYLTFDAGYENGNVAKVLDALSAEGATGAFFILGNLPDAHPDLVRRMVEEGHLVCNHTYSHRNLCGLGEGALAAELSHLEEVTRNTAGVVISKYYRPPEGKFDTAMLDEAKALGYKTVFWSFAYDDWDNGRQPNTDAAIKKILANTHNGAVILLHPTSKTNADILPELILAWRQQGYSFGTLYDLTK